MARAPQTTISHKMCMATTPVVLKRSDFHAGRTGTRDGRCRQVPRKSPRTLHKMAAAATAAAFGGLCPWCHPLCPFKDLGFCKAGSRQFLPTVFRLGAVIDPVIV